MRKLLVFEHIHCSKILAAPLASRYRRPNQRPEVIGVVVLRQTDAAKIVAERFLVCRSDKKATHGE